VLKNLRIYFTLANNGKPQHQPVLVEAQVQAKFVEVPRLENPLIPLIDVGYNAKPTFADIDNDGDFDVFIGEFLGTVKYYENTGTVNHPIFEERIGENNPLNDVDAGYFSSPTLIDIDNDNDLDAFIGREDDIEYYENKKWRNIQYFDKHQV
jgi:hypothetical protein